MESPKPQFQMTGIPKSQNPHCTGTKFGPKSIPLLAQIHKKATLCVKTDIQKWYTAMNYGAQRQKCGNLVQNLTFPPLSGTTSGRTTPSMLSGTHLLLKTLPLVAHCLKTLPSVALKSAKKGPTPS